MVDIYHLTDEDLAQSIYPPPSPSDTAALAVGGINFVIVFILNGYIIYNRDYIPFKAKQLWIVCLTCVSYFFWWFGSAVRFYIFIFFYILYLY